MESLNFSPHRVNVLVVDDNRDAADTLGFLLEMWGHRVRVVYRGVDALAAASALPPDFVFLDIGMPLMDGYAIAHCIRHELGLSDVRLVALTAYSDEGHVRRIWEEGFDWYIIKPADPIQIKRILEGMRYEKLNSYVATSCRF